jgi:hypothetical protein
MDPQLRTLVFWTLAALVFAIAVGVLATWLAMRAFG